MNNQTKDDEFISLSQQNKVKSVDMNQVFCVGAPPRGASPRGDPFLRARVYFAEIAKIRGYSQSNEKTWKWQIPRYRMLLCKLTFFEFLRTLALLKASRAAQRSS